MINNHGGLVCGLDIGPADAAARSLGLRILSPDRPGVGRSSAHPGRRTIDWATDVAEFADALALDTFGAFGWSLGGQYALALGAGLGERVVRAVIVAGCPPLDQERLDQLNATDRRLLRLSARQPRVAALTFAWMRGLAKWAPAAVEGVTARSLDPSDQQALASIPDFAAWMREALAQPTGMAEEYRAWARPWGFGLSDVRCPVTVWQGDSDALVPAQWARSLTADIPGAHLHSVAGEGHFLAYRRWDDVLAPFAG